MIKKIVATTLTLLMGLCGIFDCSVHAKARKRCWVSGHYRRISTVKNNTRHTRKVYVKSHRRRS